MCFKIIKENEILHHLVSTSRFDPLVSCPAVPFYNLSWIHQVHNSSKENSASLDLSICETASATSSSVNSGTVPKSVARPLNSSTSISPLPSTSCLLNTFRSCCSSRLPCSFSTFIFSNITPTLSCSSSSFVCFTKTDAWPSLYRSLLPMRFVQGQQRRLRARRPRSRIP